MAAHTVPELFRNKNPPPPDDVPCVVTVSFHLPPAPPPPYSIKVPVIYDDIPLPPFPVYEDPVIVLLPPLPNGGGAAPPPPPPVSPLLSEFLPPLPDIPVPVAPAVD